MLARVEINALVNCFEAHAQLICALDKKQHAGMSSTAQGAWLQHCAECNHLIENRKEGVTGAQH